MCCSVYKYILIKTPAIKTQVKNAIIKNLGMSEKVVCFLVDLENIISVLSVLTKAALSSAFLYITEPEKVKKNVER